LKVPPISQVTKAIDVHSAQADEFVLGYQELAADPYANCFAYSRHRLEGWLDRLLPPAAGRRLLDVGCGTGHHLARMRARGFEVAGVDGSTEMLARARALNPDVDLRVAEVDALPFPDASFDVALCIEVFRYLPDERACAREIARVLKPGGVGLVTAQPLFNLNGYFVINRLALLRPLAGLVSLKQFFTTSGRLRRTFQTAGFDQVDIHGVYLGPLNWVERLARPVLKPALRAWEPADRVLADAPGLRGLSNMFLARCVR
jgi:ubiquinone/menaquinone biosynthesis C-methylase UbiE